MKLPKSHKQITIEQYQAIHARLSELKEADNLDVSIEVLSVLTGKPVEEIEDLTIAELTNHINRVAWIFKEIQPIPVKKYIKVGGKWFRFVKEVTDWELSQKVDVSHFSSDDNIKQLHHLLACIAIPAKNYIVKKSHGKYNGKHHTEIAEHLQKHLDIATAWSLAVFFCQLYINWNSAILSYLSQQMKKQSQTPS